MDDHQPHDGSQLSDASATPAQKQDRGEPRRRNRPALSCIQCRSRKIRCSRDLPCASCIKSKIENCTYEESRRPKPRLWRLSPAASTPGSGHGPAEQLFAPAHFATTETTSTGSPVIHTPLSGRASDLNKAQNPDTHFYYTSVTQPNQSLTDRVRQLEQELAQALRANKDQDAKEGPRVIATGTAGAPPSTSASQFTVAVLSKTRYFGQSHWMNVALSFPFMMRLAQEVDEARDPGHSNATAALVKCKRLGRKIKAQRTPGTVPGVYGTNVPPEAEASRLVNAYLGTMESVYRILHVPTFWNEYRRYWEDPASARPSFVIQLQLCMAIGTCFQDDVLAVRPMAISWIYEAQSWLISPDEKSRVSVAGLQITCLLHLARETCGVAADLTWMSAGALVRTAMYMGLHRDPEKLPTMPVYRAEMRRRLWATIIEIALQTSIDAGGPPLISTNDFDTRPPSNFDDEQLTDGVNPKPVPKPLSTFTQSTMQITLLRSFPTRLAIARHVNDFHATTTYDDTVRLNSDLNTACRALAATLQSYDPAGVLPGRLSLFQLRLAEHMVYRFFLALNHPWLLAAQKNPAYYFSRKMCIETSMKLHQACFGRERADSSSSPSDFERLSLNGFGSYRSVPIQVMFTLQLELMWQTEEEVALRQCLQLDRRLAPDATDISAGSVGNRVAPTADLLAATRNSLRCLELRIINGDTNVKGYCFTRIFMRYVEALLDAHPEPESVLVDEAAQAAEGAWELLKVLAGETRTPTDVAASPPGTKPGDVPQEGSIEFDPQNAGFDDWNWAWGDFQALDVGHNFSADLLFDNT